MINNSGQVVWAQGNQIFYYNNGTKSPVFKDIKDLYEDCYSPKINTKGQIVWRGRSSYTSVGSRQDIFYYDTRVGIAPKIISIDDPLLWNISKGNPDINKNGQIVWYSGAPEYKIYYYDASVGGNPTTIPNSTPGLRFPYDQATRINVNGEIVFTIGISNEYYNSSTAIFYYDVRAGGEAKQISRTDTKPGTIHGYANSIPEINDNCQIVWFGEACRADNTLTYAIYYYDARVGGDAKIISNIDAPSSWSFGDPKINNKGQVIWDQADGIFYYDTRIGEDPKNIFSSPYIMDYGINDNGEMFVVAYMMGGRVYSEYNVFYFDRVGGSPVWIAWVGDYDIHGPIQFNVKGQMVWSRYHLDEEHYVIELVNKINKGDLGYLLPLLLWP